MQIKLNNELKQILSLLAEGKTNGEIAEALNYSLRTVVRRVNLLFKIYKVKNRMQLVQEYAAEQFSVC